MGAGMVDLTESYGIYMRRVSFLTIPFASLCVAFGAYGATLTVVVEGLPSAKGHVAVAVYPGEQGFPKDDTKAIRRVRAPIDSATLTANAVWQDLPAGTYAVSVFHDDNDSGKLETNFFGVPVKCYGFSNNPKPGLRAAKYSEASFMLPAGGTVVKIGCGLAQRPKSP